jgi:hypothetical protein
MSSRAQHYREAERLLEALPPDKRGRHAGDEGSGADAGGITRPCKGSMSVADVLYFETAFSSVRAWSVWSYA